MDERCAACVMGRHGGTEEPCVSQVELALYRDPPQSLAPHLRPLPGQLCPRVDLDPENWEGSQLAVFSIHEMKRPLLPALFDLLTEHYDWNDKMALFVRYQAALSDPVVHEILYPKPKETE